MITVRQYLDTNFHLITIVRKHHPLISTANYCNPGCHLQGFFKAGGWGQQPGQAQEGSCHSQPYETTKHQHQRLMDGMGKYKQYRSTLHHFEMLGWNEYVWVCLSPVPSTGMQKQTAQQQTPNTGNTFLLLSVNFTVASPWSLRHKQFHRLARSRPAVQNPRARRRRLCLS